MNVGENKSGVNSAKSFAIFERQFAYETEKAVSPSPTCPSEFMLSYREFHVPSATVNTNTFNDQERLFENNRKLPQKRRPFPVLA